MESPKPVEITGMRSFQKNAKTPLLNQKRGNQSKNGESNGKTGSITGNCIALKGRKSMRKKDFKGRCQKKAYNKCEGVCRTYDSLQTAYAEEMERRDDVISFSCNVPMEGTTYMTDFVCKKEGGALMVRECILRKNLLRPRNTQLLDMSREYWTARGVKDWGLVVDEEE